MTKENPPKWAAIVDDRLVPMPRRRLKARDILHQAAVPPGRSLVRDYNSPNDVAFEPDADIDLGEGNVFRTAEDCQHSHQITCEAPAKLAFVVDDRWEVTIQPNQTGETLRGLFNLPQNVDLLRDHESPRDEAIEDDQSFAFGDGPVFITTPIKPVEITIHIDHKPYQVKQRVLNGSQLRTTAKPPISADYDLWLEIPGPGDDQKIGDQQPVRLKNGMQFYSVLREINPGAN